MKQLINTLFPLVDYLYIYQLLEYESGDFLRWFSKHPFKRSLQRKHQIVWTSKAKLLFIISLCLILGCSFLLTRFIWGEMVDLYFLITWLGLFVYFAIFSPLFLVLAQIILSPLEIYKREKTIKLAKNKLSKLTDLKVIAIDGSYAKTSTKDMLYTLLWKDFNVVKTPKSYNTLLSISKTIIDLLKAEVELFIVEMDAYHKGDIKKLANLVNPQIGIITSIAPQHLERFGKIETLAKTQFELAQNLVGEKVLVLNNQSEWIKKLEGEYQVNKKVFYGNEGEIFASEIKQQDDSLSFVLNSSKGKIKIKLPLMGEHHIENFLAASAVALELGLSLKKLQERASHIMPTPHRMEIKTQGNLTIIDNSYNTNPDTAKKSLENLSQFKQLKVLITPGFVELGDQAETDNKEFGQNAAKVADQIIIVGENAKDYLLAGLRKAEYPKDQIHKVKTTKDALIKLGNITQGQETVVLIENDLPDQYF